VRAVGELQVVVDRDAVRPERIDLRQESARVDDEPVADDVDEAGTADARRDEAEAKCLSPN